MSLSRWNKSREELRRRQHGNHRRRRPLLSEHLESRSLLASISGTVWNDYNANGRINFGEPRLPGWQVYLDGNNNGKLDSASTTATFSSSQVPRDIPDLGTVTSTRTISGLTGTVQDLNVKLSITHTWDEDLSVFLISPNNTQVELFSGVGGSDENFFSTVLDDEATRDVTAGSAPFTGSFRPEGLLSDFDDEDPNGVWTLQIRDTKGDDVGTLNSWSMTIRNNTFTEANTVTDAGGNYSFTGLGAGSQKVRLISQTGFSSTIPSSGLHSVSLTASQNLFPLNFGVREPASSVAGSMWDDWDGDAKRDGNEPPMANRVVFLDANNDGFLNSTSDTRTFTKTTPLSIPDVSTVRSLVTVPTDLGGITDLNVTLDIDHPNITDLSATLISPSGTRVKLFQTLTSNGPGFDNTTFDDKAAVSINDATPPFSGTFRPEQPLTNLNTETALGTWQLEITDNGPGNVGTLNSWSMTVVRANAERSKKTDAQGNYAFFALPPGSYDIAQKVIADYTPTAPRSVTLKVEQNFDTSVQSNGGEYQPRIAVDPNQLNRLFMVSSRSGGGFIGAYSVDGGVLWNPRQLTGGDGLPNGLADPDVAFDEFGNLFLAYQATSGEIIVALSTDGGQSFSVLKDIAAGSEPSIVTAQSAVWVSYTRPSPPTTQISVSGASITGLGLIGQFSTPSIAPSSHDYSFSDVEIGPNGELAVVYVLANNSGAPTTVQLAVDPDGLGAQGFTPAVPVVDTNVGTANFVGAFSTGPGVSLAWDRSGGDHDGRLYVAYADETPDASQNLDIFLISTDDFGATWTAPVRANSVASRAQFMPGMALDQTTGDVFVAWYDAKNDTGNPLTGSNDNLLNTDVQFVGAISVNGGSSFLATTPISAGVTNVPGAGVSQNVGQRTGVAFHNGVLHPVWVDNADLTSTNPNGALNDFDILTSTVTVNTGGRSPHHVILIPGSTLTGLNFANHLNPKLTGFTTINYVEDNTQQIAPDVVLTQPTVPDFSNSTLTVRLEANAEGTDRLGIRNTALVTVTANEVSFNGVVVGTFVGGDATAPLVVRFNANTELPAVQAVIRAVTFKSLSDNPATAQRRVSFIVTDGHRGTSATSNAFIKVQRVNDAPVIANLGSASLFEEDLPAINIVPAATLSDPDSFNFNTGKLTVRLISKASSGDRITIQKTGTGQGQISITSGGLVKYQNVTIGTFTGGSGTTPLVVTFNTSSSILGVQALLRCLQFSTVGENPSGATRQVSLVMSDGDGGTSQAAVKDIQVRPIDDAPIITLSGSVGYTLNAASIAIAPAATIVDVDNANFDRGNLTVHISTRAEDQNRLEIGGGFTVSNFKVMVDGVQIGTVNVNGGVGTTDLVVTFNAEATVSRVQRLIRAIRFRTVGSVQTGGRAISFTVDDGSGASSNTAIRTVNVQ